MNYLTKVIILILLITWSCGQKPASTENEEMAEKRPTVEMVTTKGTIVLELYNETPKHRDNFIKLVNEGAYDSLLFHRVIEEFMIQGGDPDSKNAQPEDTLGSGGLDYRVDAEFNKELFHKKGVLAAARDGNPERASSSMQFYIVQGKVFNDSTLDAAQDRINGWLGEHFFKQDPANKALADSLQAAIDAEDWEGYVKFNDSIRSAAKDYSDFEKYIIPEAHREVYKTIGGTPHLDQNYTAYGEVTQGLEVVDSIAAVQTNDLARPITDVRILSMRVLE